MKWVLNGKVGFMMGFSDIVRPLWCEALLEIIAKVMARDINGCRENSEITDLSKNYEYKKLCLFSDEVLNHHGL